MLVEEYDGNVRPGKLVLFLDKDSRVISVLDPRRKLN